MNAYRNFSVASYMFAYYVNEATDQQIRDGALTRTAPAEYAYEITAAPGRSICLKILR